MTPELLLPVGNMSMCLAAIHHGADAIYVGVPGFNARGRSQDFTRAELQELIELCHLYGVKVHLAFNVLVFENELHEAAQLLEEILPLGPDAFIVQDLGLVRLIRQMAPHQRLHGSTQMTVTNDEAIKLVEDLNLERFVLGRENSLDEIKLIRAATSRELEVFVHGALCVAYSGQCFTSESLGGRSANRGQCAQSCRLGYDLIVDGEKRDLGPKQYLVSPQDLCGIEEVPQLIQLGVNSFKVEGRLKTPEYVATAGQHYSAVIRGADPHEARRKQEMAVSFGRGFFTGWLGGVDHQQLVEGTFSAHRGFEVGTVLSVNKDRVALKLSAEIQAGQGLVFETSAGEIGGKIHSVFLRPDHVEALMLAPFDGRELRAGARVWINSDDKLKARTQRAMTDRELMKRIPLDLELRLSPGAAALLTVRDPEGHEVVVSGAVVRPALHAPTTASHAEDELGALGTTAFRLRELKFTNDGGHLSQKELKELRRAMVTAITQARVKVTSMLAVSGAEALRVLSTPRQAQTAAILTIVLRERAQVDDLLASLDRLDREALGPIILDYEFGKDYAESVRLLKGQGLVTGIATTRILKPREYYNFKIIERAEPEVILVRNLGALQYFQHKPFRLMGDFSLNAANSLTVDYLLGKGLESVCASYDLNQQQLKALARTRTAGLEINLHQYMPEFHMEHCVFAAFMSKGSSFKDCGKPCEKHKVELKDAYGNMHFLKADQECRNTMFRATPQSAAFLIHELPEVKRWRFEALYERGEVLVNKINTYAAVLKRTLPVEAVTQLLGSTEKYGVTEGQLNNFRVWKDRKKSLIEERQ